MAKNGKKKLGLFLNREISHIKFNRRVLELAQEGSLPLLESLRLFFICSENLDEFFEIRVAGLKEKVALGSLEKNSDGLSAVEVLQQVDQIAHELVDELYATLNNTFLPLLAKQSIEFIRRENWTAKQKKWIEKYFHDEILPTLSPIALDISHPFPRLVNKNLNFIVSLEGKDAFGRNTGLAIVHVPRLLPRILPLESNHKDRSRFIFLTHIIEHHIQDLFPGLNVTGCYQFRVTRNSDLWVDEEEYSDLAFALKNELQERRYGRAVRLEISYHCPDAIANYLLEQEGLTEQDLYRCHGPVNLARYMMILDLINRPDLHFPEHNPILAERIIAGGDLFAQIKKRDILLYHPFNSFMTVVDLIRQATKDPNVMAIKQTLYRTGDNSIMVQALVDAARAGKEVVAVIEIRARFDEEENIELANRLQEAGALVVYGVMGYKTHAKMLLIVRREGKQIKRFVHLGTGNYHANTAKAYTDIGLLTCDKNIGNDVQTIFQQLTGLGKFRPLKCLLTSPFTMQKRLISFIHRETKHARQGKPAHIIAKMNSLSEQKIIKALYRASRAGVKIDLIVRGICCLRPGVKHISENIQVRSVLGRFLEHTRIFYFLNNGNEKIYCSSADWMERNFFHRTEVCFPINDKQLAEIVKKDGLMVYLQDNCLSWQLDGEGNYHRNHPGNQQPRAAQTILLQKYAR